MFSLGYYLVCVICASLQTGPIHKKRTEYILPDYSDCKGSETQTHEYFSWFPKHPDPETTFYIENFYHNNSQEPLTCLTTKTWKYYLCISVTSKHFRKQCFPFSKWRLSAQFLNVSSAHILHLHFCLVLLPTSLESKESTGLFHIPKFKKQINWCILRFEKTTVETSIDTQISIET